MMNVPALRKFNIKSIKTVDSFIREAHGLFAVYFAKIMVDYGSVD